MDALLFIGGALGILIVGPVALAVGGVMLVDKVWGYEPDAYELSYGNKA